MPPIITTGINSAAQAAEILATLKTELGAVGISRVTRGRLWKFPDPPFAALFGPSRRTEPLSLGGEYQGAWHWTVLIARRFDENDARAAELDTWADICEGALFDLLPNATTFDFEVEDLPERVEDERLGQLVERLGEDRDCAVISFGTRSTIVAPC